MGGTDKGANINIKLQPGKNKECVSEAIISKLLDDFNCANLLTSTRETTVTSQRPSVVEESHPNYEEVVSSLKQLHLKKPINRRTRLKEKKILERKAKNVSANRYNLSVAAVNAQKPVLWPGKLNGVSRKIDSDGILLPSKLSVPLPGSSISQPSCPANYASSFLNNSSEEKSRIADSLRLHGPLFRNPVEIDNTYMSFSELSKRNSNDIKGGMISSDKVLITSEDSSLGERQNCHCPNTKQQQNVDRHKEHNVCHPTMFSDCRSPEHSKTGIPPVRRCPHFESHVDFTEVCLPAPIKDSDLYGRITAENNERSAISSDETPCARFSQSSSTPSGTGNYSIDRSCSEEVRMEESNVIELASYFEDLLHIPRKMSVMAEMMYA